MSIDYKLLGERIKIQRLSKGTTQEHFAEHMNVSVGYISQMTATWQKTLIYYITNYPHMKKKY